MLRERQAVMCRYRPKHGVVGVEEEGGLCVRGDDEHALGGLGPSPRSRRGSHRSRLAGDGGDGRGPALDRRSTPRGRRCEPLRLRSRLPRTARARCGCRSTPGRAGRLTDQGGGSSDSPRGRCQIRAGRLRHDCWPTSIDVLQVELGLSEEYTVTGFPNSMSSRRGVKPRRSATLTEAVFSGRIMEVK